MRAKIGLWMLWSVITLAALHGGQGDNGLRCIGDYLVGRLGFNADHAMYQRLRHALCTLEGDSSRMNALADSIARRVALVWLSLSTVPLLIGCRTLGALIVSMLGIGYIAAIPYRLLRREKQAQSAVRAALPEVINRLIFMMRAGVIIETAWAEVAESGEGEIYTEMKAIHDRRASGEGIVCAYRSFGQRFDWQPITEVAEAMAQSVTLGGEALIVRLERIRKTLIRARRRAFEAQVQAMSQRLIFPSLLIFVGIMILVIVPMLWHAMHGL